MASCQPPPPPPNSAQMLQLLLANIWKNTDEQKFDEEPELVAREEKMQGIVMDHISDLVSEVLEASGQETVTETWPTGSPLLTLTTTYHRMPAGALAATPVWVGGSEAAFGASVQGLVEGAVGAGATALVVAVELAPVMDPDDPNAVVYSALAEALDTARVTPVVSVRLSARRGPDAPWEAVAVRDRPGAISLTLPWVTFRQNGTSDQACLWGTRGERG